jgi:nucleoside-diphosphate-sugar epimerase
MQTAFVTGGSGFLGQRLIEILVERGWSVRALARSPSSRAKVAAVGAQPVEGDLDDKAALARGAAGCDVIFHAAALFTMWAPADDFERINVTGTKNVLEAARQTRMPTLVQIGASAVVMGNRKPLRNITEELPLTYPSWAPYITSKAKAQALVLKANSPGELKTAVILPPSIWGPGAPMLDGVVEDIKAGRFAWPGGGRQRMSTSHIENVCECALLAAENSKGGCAYFVTDGEDRTLREVMSDLVWTRGVKARGPNVSIGVAWFVAGLMETWWRLFRLRGAPPLTRQMLRMIGADFTLNDSRARTELGYRPRISWSEGIAAMRG